MTRTAANELLASVERALAHHHITGNIRSWRPSEPGPGHLIVSSDGRERRTRSLSETLSYTLGLASAAKACEKRTYSRAQVDAAVHAASALLVDGLRPDGQGLGERDSDLMDLKSAAVLALLDDPAVTIDQVIERGDYDTPPQVLRGWWDGWT